MSSRLSKLYERLQEGNLDAVAFNPGPMLTYLTGLHFHLMERPVVFMFVPGQPPAAVLPELEKPKLDLLPYPVQAFLYSENPLEWEAAFRKAVQALGVDGKSIGVEPRRMRLLEFKYIRDAAPEADYPDASEVISALRISKDKAEIEAMRKAVHVAEEALTNTLPLVKIGMTEKELAAELTVQLLRSGSEPEMPFSPIVASGPNSANPHAAPTGRKLQPGDLLLIDWGSAVNGYLSDLTRTFAIGEVDKELQTIHAIVEQANAAGRAEVRPGEPAANVDIAARNVITQAGYGPWFTHRTGHGIGMEGHEAPYMRGDNMQILQVGMTFTIEPGIYLPGRGGVRIEDDVVVTETGGESLSNLARHIIRID